MPVTTCAAMRLVERDAAGTAVLEVPKAVGGRKREQRRPDGDEQVNRKPAVAVTKLALEPDGAAERGGETMRGRTSSQEMSGTHGAAASR